MGKLMRWEAKKDVVSFWGFAEEYHVHIGHGRDSNYRLQETRLLQRRNKMATVGHHHHMHCNSSAQTPVNSSEKSCHPAV
jgi:hypothetical protein